MSSWSRSTFWSERILDDHCMARSGSDDPREHADCGRLAGAVGAEEAINDPGRQREHRSWLHYPMSLRT